MIWTTKDIIVFLAGAQTFHTLSHLVIGLDGALPIKFFFINWTKQLNYMAIAINAVITAGLFWWLYTSY